MSSLQDKLLKLDPVANEIWLQRKWQTATKTDYASILHSLINEISDNEPMLREMFNAVSKHRFPTSFGFDVSAYLIANSPKKNDESSKKISKFRPFDRVPPELMLLISENLNVKDRAISKVVCTRFLFEMLWASDRYSFPSVHFRKMNANRADFNIFRNTKRIVFSDEADLRWYSLVDAPNVMDVTTSMQPDLKIWEQLKINRFKVKCLDIQCYSMDRAPFLSLYAEIFPNVENLTYSDVNPYSLGLFPDQRFPDMRWSKLKSIYVSDPTSVVNLAVLVGNKSTLEEISVVGTTDGIYFADGESISDYSLKSLRVGRWVDDTFLVDAVRASPDLRELEFTRYDLMIDVFRMDPAMMRLQEVLRERTKLDTLTWKGDMTEIDDAMEWLTDILSFGSTKKKRDSFFAYFVPDQLLFGPQESDLRIAVQNLVGTLDANFKEWKIEFSHSISDSYINWNFGFPFDAQEFAEEQENYVIIAKSSDLFL